MTRKTYEGALALHGNVLTVDYNVATPRRNKKYDFNVPLEDNDLLIINDKRGKPVLSGIYKKYDGCLDGFLSNAKQIKDKELIQIFNQKGNSVSVSRENFNGAINEYMADVFAAEEKMADAPIYVGYNKDYKVSYQRG